MTTELPLPSEPGRSIQGVVDDFSPKGLTEEGESKRRKDLLWKIGYKQ